jgi:hypothetical protein
MPLVNTTPPTNIPLFVPMMSLALPSAGHHATKPAGGGVQDGSDARLVVKTSVDKMVIAIDRTLPGENFITAWMAGSFCFLIAASPKKAEERRCEMVAYCRCL